MLHSRSYRLHSPPGRYVAWAIGTIAVVLVAACPKMITDSSYVVNVSPPSANLFVDDSVQFTASVRDQHGDTVTAPLAWSVDPADVATVNATGWVRAVGAGTATVRASAQGATASASLVVVVDSGQTLTVSPNNAHLFISLTQQFSATVRNRKGEPVSASPEWSSSNTAVATVNDKGLVTAISAGSATIQAKVRNLVATADITVTPEPATMVLAGAGDIASCGSDADEATAKLLDGISGTVFTAGDNAYDNGTATEYSTCYGPTWGRHKSRTHPAPGNHDYNTARAAGYFGYFGAAAGDAGKGYYSYDLGGWHVIVLNSNIAMSAGSTQETWLRSDLANHAVRCTLAIWHHPRFSSGHHGSSIAPQPLWQALYDAGADLVVVGHDHIYERFAPQTPDGHVDAARGIREFVVGTGGAGLYAFEHPAANSEAKNNQTHGVLKLTLYADRYDWKFVPVAGSTFTDSGTGSCH